MGIGQRRRDRLRRRTVGMVVDSAFSALSRAGSLFPTAKADYHGVEHVADLPYAPPHGRVDLWRPRGVPGPLPVAFYVHGGGFTALSKDTHWLMGLVFARRGWLLVNVDYRLAPKHPFPTPLQDVIEAWRWLGQHVVEHGGDPERVVLAGESAGANLVSALAVATSWRRPEPWARPAYDVPLRVRAVLPLCGMLQVSDSGRFARRRPLSQLIADRIEDVEDVYLRGVSGPAPLADPLCVIEQEGEPDRPLPPFFLPVGTRDPLLDDSRRMAAALARRGVPHQLAVYPGERHAFMALVWRTNALRCWKDLFGFLEQQTGIRSEVRRR